MEIGYDLSRLFQRLNIQAGKRQNFGNGEREKKMVLRDIFSNFAFFGEDCSYPTASNEIQKQRFNVNSCWINLVVDEAWYYSQQLWGTEPTLSPFLRPLWQILNAGKGFDFRNCVESKKEKIDNFSQARKTIVSRVLEDWSIAVFSFIRVSRSTRICSLMYAPICRRVDNNRLPARAGKQSVGRKLVSSVFSPGRRGGEAGPLPSSI